MAKRTLCASPRTPAAARPSRPARDARHRLTTTAGDVVTLGLGNRDDPRARQHHSSKMQADAARERVRSQPEDDVVTQTATGILSAQFSPGCKVIVALSSRTVCSGVRFECAAGATSTGPSTIRSVFHISRSRTAGGSRRPSGPPRLRPRSRSRSQPTRGRAASDVAVAFVRVAIICLFPLGVLASSPSAGERLETRGRSTARAVGWVFVIRFLARALRSAVRERTAWSERLTRHARRCMVVARPARSWASPDVSRRVPRSGSRVRAPASRSRSRPASALAARHPPTRKRSSVSRRSLRVGGPGACDAARSSRDADSCKTYSRTPAAGAQKRDSPPMASRRGRRRSRACRRHVTRLAHVFESNPDARVRPEYLPTGCTTTPASPPGWSSGLSSTRPAGPAAVRPRVADAATAVGGEVLASRTTGWASPEALSSHASSLSLGGRGYTRPPGSPYEPVVVPVDVGAATGVPAGRRSRWCRWWTAS